MYKVLIVDDERLTREILVNHMPWSYLNFTEIFEACDGAAALQLAFSIMPDLVICDIKMPRMDGIEFATLLRMKNPDCKLIFLSSYANKEHLKSAIHLGAMDFVEKPIDIEEIWNIVIKAAKSISDEKFSKMRQIKTMIDINQQRVLLRLINDNPKGDLDSLQKNSPVDFSSYNTYKVVSIKLNHSGQDSFERKEERAEIVIHLLQNTLKTNYTDVLLAQKNNDCIVALIMCTRKYSSNTLKALLENFLTKICENKNFSLELFIGAGNEVFSIDQIYISYQNSLTCIKRQFFYGCNQIVHYEKINTPAFINKTNVSREIAERLMQGDLEGSVKIAEDFTDTLRKNVNTNISYVKNCYFEIISFIYKYFEGTGYYHDSRDDKAYIWELILNAITLEMIKTHLVDFIRHIYDNIITDSANNTIPLKLLDYINHHVYDYSLSVQTLADTFKLTPSYVCRLFKNETGKTINKYITDLRIGKAKDLLENCYYKKNEIYKNIGFLDAKYFSKVFKKETGVTPIEYHCKYKK